jgi:hypothetical protein
MSSIVEDYQRVLKGFLEHPKLFKIGVAMIIANNDHSNMKELLSWYPEAASAKIIKKAIRECDGKMVEIIMASPDAGLTSVEVFHYAASIDSGLIHKLVPVSHLDHMKAWKMLLKDNIIPSSKRLYKDLRYNNMKRILSFACEIDCEGFGEILRRSQVRRSASYLNILSELFAIAARHKSKRALNVFDEMVDLPIDFMVHGSHCYILANEQSLLHEDWVRDDSVDESMFDEGEHKYILAF